MRACLDTLQDALRRQGVLGKWTDPAGAHLTVLFLGEQAPANLDRLSRQLPPALTAVNPFTLQADALGTFGRPARVLYLGLTGTGLGEYAHLTQVVRAAASAAGLAWPGYGRKQDPVPHLTLARFRGAREARTWRRVEGLAPQERTSPDRGADREMRGCAAVFRQLHLFESVLRPIGPEHRLLQSFSFGKGREAPRQV